MMACIFPSGLYKCPVRRAYRRSRGKAVLFAIILFALFCLGMACAVSSCAPEVASARRPVDLTQPVAEIPAKYRR
ncbi:hypothetical protein BH09VER1_BH09VER1_28570 [soil metagenome]